MALQKKNFVLIDRSFHIGFKYSLDYFYIAVEQKSQTFKGVRSKVS